MTVQKQVAATVALGRNWLAAAVSPSVACSADGGPRIVSCHHTMEIYGRKEAFSASVLSVACARLNFCTCFHKSVREASAWYWLSMLVW